MVPTYLFLKYCNIDKLLDFHWYNLHNTDTTYFCANYIYGISKIRVSCKMVSVYTHVYQIMLIAN